jgi:hypothetical protein
MAYLIQQKSLSEAWIAAMELLLDCDGKAVNLNVAFQADASDSPSVGAEIDAFVEKQNLHHNDGNLLIVNTVANTIFPAALYHPHLGDEAAPRLYENYALSMRMHRRRKGDKETYFNRLVAYPVGPEINVKDKPLLNPDGTWNQLAYYIDRLRRQRETRHLSSSYELGVSHPNDAELRVQMPLKDKRMTSFPCLSHISFTLVNDLVHMNATYRNQTFITRAYGNYLGLANLLGFVARESGAQAGEIQVVATHADAELSLGKLAVRELVEQCRLAVGPTVKATAHA